VKSDLRARAVDAGYGAGWQLVRHLPQSLAHSVFQRGADFGFRRNGKGTRQLRVNLRRVVGPSVGEAELDELVRAGLRSYSRYWMETFRLPTMSTGDVLSYTHTTGAEHIDRANAAGKGVILALPHSGNWDVAGIWLIDRGLKFTTVAERLKPDSLFDRFVAYREGLGMEIVPLSGGTRPPTEILAERLRAGGCVCLLADRDLSSKGVGVTFFGEPATMPPGPALLAATTGATLLPVCVYYEPAGWGQWIGAPIELDGERLRDRVASATQGLADVFGQRIAAHPADWHMLQKLWLADLDPARAANRG
jgi:lauroyl/myristoyl acyltransferase